MNATTTDPTWVQLLSVTTTTLALTFSATTTILYYVLYPVSRLLAVVWYILAFLSSPFVYIGGVIANIAMIPWRIFAAFEVCCQSALLSQNRMITVYSPSGTSSVVQSSLECRLLLSCTSSCALLSLSFAWTKGLLRDPFHPKGTMQHRTGKQGKRRSDNSWRTSKS